MVCVAAACSFYCYILCHCRMFHLLSHNLFIHSPIERLLVWFQFGAVTNKAVTNVLTYVPRDAIAGS